MDDLEFDSKFKKLMKEARKLTLDAMSNDLELIINSADAINQVYESDLVETETLYTALAAQIRECAKDALDLLWQIIQVDYEKAQTKQDYSASQDKTEVN